MSLSFEQPNLCISWRFWRGIEQATVFGEKQTLVRTWCWIHEPVDFCNQIHICTLIMLLFRSWLYIYAS